jgi:hypothetical protein
VSAAVEPRLPSDDAAHACCTAYHEIDCDACGGTGLYWPWAPGGDPDHCPACGGSGVDVVPAHPFGESHA